MSTAFRHQPGAVARLLSSNSPSMLAPPCTTWSKRSMLLLLLLACMVLLLSSCGKADRKSVYSVRGQVFDGKNRPAVGALVIFHPVDRDDPEPTKPLAYVDDKGAFSLTTYESGDGAPEGEYVVTIEWRPKSASPFAANKEGEDRLHGRYSDPKTSNLRFKIEKRADNVLPAIQVR